MKTKEKILLESMKLFSTNGFDAVSIRTIADAVGIGNSALYKHFSGKQEILDCIVEQSKKNFCLQYQEVSYQIETVDEWKKACMKMFQFQIQNEWICMFRKLLIIEQFKNPEMARIYREFFIELPIQSQKEVFEQYMKAGIIKKMNAEVLAMELYAPFFMYHTIHKDNLEDLLQAHIDNFFDSYIIKDGEENK